MHPTTAGISHNRTAQQELKTSRMHFIDYLESVSELFFALDNNLNIIYWSKTMTGASGITPEHAIGHRFSDFYCSDYSHNRLHRVFRGIIRSQKERRVVYKYNKQIYDLFIYPFSPGVAVIVRSKSEMLQKKIEDAKNREHGLKNISLQLHNNVGQYLSALSLRCAELETRMRKQQSVTLDDVKGIHDICIATSESLHDLTQSFFYNTVDVLSDKDIIQNLCLNVNKFFCIDIRFNVAMYYLPQNILDRNHVMQFLQEALVNAAKYSGKKEIQLSIQRSAGNCIVYSISDKGGGFDTTNVSNGMGLKLMQFNADELGADFHIRSNNHGTVCVLKLPLNNLE
jgi:PAS domain S-box-containing protein